MVVVKVHCSVGHNHKCGIGDGFVQEGRRPLWIHGVHLGGRSETGRWKPGAEELYLGKTVLIL